jgi:hypothetical protein
MALSTIARKQAKGTKLTMKKCKQLLDYLATHPNATVQFHASNMILSIHSNVSYLSEDNTHSRVCGHFFMGWQPDAMKPKIEWGVFHPMCNFTLRRCFHSRSQTWCPLPQMQTGHYLSTHTRRNGPSSTPHPRQLQQFHRHWHCQHYRQLATFPVDGNEVLLGCRCGCPGEI